MANRKMYRVVVTVTEGFILYVEADDEESARAAASRERCVTGIEPYYNETTEAAIEAAEYTPALPMYDGDIEPDVVAPGKGTEEHEEMMEEYGDP